MVGLACLALPTVPCLLCLALMLRSNLAEQCSNGPLLNTGRAHCGHNLGLGQKLGIKASATACHSCRTVSTWDVS